MNEKLPAKDLIRQGDLLFIPRAFGRVEVAPKSGGIIAQGEATGHHHRIAEADLPYAELYEAQVGNSNQIRKFLRVTERGIAIVHEEHATVQLPPGEYEVHQAREYDYSNAVTRYVAD